MKNRLIAICACVCALGITTACSGEKEPTQAEAPQAATEQAAPAKRAKPAAKAPKAVESAKKKAEEPVVKSDEYYANLTNGECFPDSIPDSAPQTAKLCISLVKSAPDAPFTRQDLEGMPEDCKPYVLPKCR